VSIPRELLSAARTAPFVFFGTVRRPGGSNVELLESDEYPSAVVRVDEVVTAPGAVGDLTGREVTVHLSKAGALARSSRHLFMATSLQFGDELAVAEIARVPHRRQVEQELRRAVLEEKLTDLDEAQAERLRLAAAVVYGVVQRIEPVSPTDTAGPAEAVGEAVPGFRAAVLKVWRMLKGRPDEEPRIIFPFPRTQKWSEVPLFVEGEEGVWILQPARGQTLGAGKVKVPDVPNAFTALDPLDFHTPGLLSRIETLLAAAEPPASPRRARRR
jgi:hypothetical protein